MVREPETGDYRHAERRPPPRAVKQQCRQEIVQREHLAPTAYVQTMGENAKSAPATAPAVADPDAATTVAAITPAAAASQSAEKRLTRHATDLIGTSVTSFARTV